MKSNLAKAFGLMLSLAVTNTFAPPWASAQEVSKMTKEELKGMLGNPDVIIIDVRSGRSWDDSTLIIKGAVREDPGGDQCPCGTAVHGERIHKRLCLERRLERMGRC